MVSLKATAAAFLMAGAALAAPEASNANTMLRLIYHNNLNSTDDANHIGAILLSPLTYVEAEAACEALSEKLLPKADLMNHLTGFAPELSYLAYAGYGESPNQAYFIGDSGVVIANKGASTFRCADATDRAYYGAPLPVLCTQSVRYNEATESPAVAGSEITVKAAGNWYTGYRNQKSWRFLGIKYGQYPERWTYSTLYNVTGTHLNATAYGPKCLQYGSGSEDCLFLNIQTPYIPKQGSTANLRPVHFWIHGGGFTGGTGSDPGSDGGNLASREDVVTVTINYRLSTLGFFAVPGVLSGNYGIGDQITALQWTINNIANFGGDPNMITINGESAGAGSVRTLLGSPKAIGMFQGAIAMSNLGGGVDLGEKGNYGTTYSTYYTVNQSFAVAGEQILQKAGCNQTTLAAQVACLRAYPGDLTSFPTVARYVVQDGTIVNTPELEVGYYNDNVAHVNAIWGVTMNDGASFSAYSHNCTTEAACLAANLYTNSYYANAIIASGLFPYYDTGNVTADSFNVSQRIITDNTFRCVDQATAYAGFATGNFKSAYYYQMDRTVRGYNPNNVDGTGPIEPGYPLGNPNLPYYRLHGSDMPWVFGILYSFRDANDLYSIQLTTDYFGSFIRTGNPNPPMPLLQVRDYTKTIQAVQKSGPWNPVSADTGPIKQMDYPSFTSTFVDLPQCAWLNYSIQYYLEDGRK